MLSTTSKLFIQSDYHNKSFLHSVCTSKQKMAMLDSSCFFLTWLYSMNRFSFLALYRPASHRKEKTNYKELTLKILMTELNL